MNKDILFSDFDLGLRKHNGTGDIYKIKNVNSILNSIHNILRYNMFEKKFNPLFGSNISNMLFELNGISVEHDIKIMIENAINNYEPRVILLDIDVEMIDHSVSIDLEFNIVGFDDVYKETIFLYKAR